MEEWEFDGADWVCVSLTPLAVAGATYITYVYVAPHLGDRITQTGMSNILLSLPFLGRSASAPAAPRVDPVQPGDRVVLTHGSMLDCGNACYGMDSFLWEYIKAPIVARVKWLPEKERDLPHLCACGSPCLMLFTSIECSNPKCKNYKENIA